MAFIKIFVVILLWERLSSRDKKAGSIIELAAGKPLPR